VVSRIFEPSTVAFAKVGRLTGHDRSSFNHLQGSTKRFRLIGIGKDGIWKGRPSKIEG